jgi:hypothetical protein
MQKGVNSAVPARIFVKIVAIAGVLPRFMTTGSGDAPPIPLHQANLCLF